MGKAILIVLDSLGVGGAPDASLYNDEGSNTFGSIALACSNGDADIGRKGALKVPNLESLGIYSATRLSTGLTLPNTDSTIGSYAVAQEHSKGKDTPTGHHEIVGYTNPIGWYTFPEVVPVFPEKQMDMLIQEAKVAGFIGNKHASGEDIIKEYGLDPLRYYLLKEVSFGNDGNISKDKLISCINSDLANNFGNLCQRVLAFTEKNLSLKVPKPDVFSSDDLILLNNFTNNYDNLIDYIDNQNINLYMNFIVEQMFLANKYFNDQEPWKKKDNKIRLNTIIYTSLELIRKISLLLYPVIPNSALKALSIFDIKENDLNIETIKNNSFLTHNISLNKIDILFNKVELHD